MIVVDTLADLRRERRVLTGALGLVPTMGSLHEGHLSLVRRARDENEHTGVSIFVNPTQFGPADDLASYPRDLDSDLRLLDALRVDLVCTPTTAEIYPQGFQTYVTVEDLTQPLEGAHRPGHFRGVTTVVAKLFNAFTPERAYFGQKDAQQARVIRQMAADLSLPVEVVVCPIVRDPDGVALSSRNAYLSPREREAATVLFRALSAGAGAYKDGAREGDTLRTAMLNVLKGEPLAEPEYISAADPVTLAELEQVERGALLSLAVRVGGTRLIDNLLLD